MPITAANRARYPADWPQVRQQILTRAQHRCEWPGCGVRDHAIGQWVMSALLGRRIWRPVCGNALVDAAGQGLSWPDLQPLGYREAHRLAREISEANGVRLTVIVLTIAHLDHQPEHCAPDNLRAWCQQHHLAYDQPLHLANAYMTRRERANTKELF